MADWTPPKSSYAPAEGGWTPPAGSFESVDKSSGYDQYMDSPQAHEKIFDRVANSPAAKLLKAFGYFDAKLSKAIAPKGRDYGLQGTVEAVNSVFDKVPGLTLPQKAVEFAGRSASSPLLLAGPIGRAIGGKISEIGTNTAQAAIKPSKALREARGGKFDVENLVGPESKPLNIPDAPKELASKLGKGKTLENLEKYHNALDARYEEVLANSKASISPVKAVDDATAELSEAFSASKNRGPIKAEIEKALQVWKRDAKDAEKLGPLDGLKAREYRKSLREEAMFQMSNQSATKGSRLAAAEIYNALNKQIAKQIPEMRVLDAEFAKTIPLRNAISTSLGREANNYPIGIREAFVIAATHGLDPASLAAAAGKIAAIKATSKFGSGVAMRQAGDLLKKQGKIPTSALVGSAENTMDSDENSYLSRTRGLGQ